jgi:predicted NUDIX family NTP pyrophosphohydrolase
MAKLSAGILLYRRASSNPTSLEVLLVHPGGPFWARKDLGAWSIPKGEPEPQEELFDAARREFAEETGATIENGGDAQPLSSVQQPGGKTVHAWAIEGDFDPAQLSSNRFMLEWPRGSGRMQEIPEVDRAEWFSLAEAKRRINPAQVVLIERLEGLKA